MTGRLAAVRGVRGQSVLALSLPLALVVGLATLLLQTVPPKSPDRIERYEAVAPLPPLLPGDTVKQKISTTGQGRVHLLARFGTYGGAEDCRIRVTVRSEDDAVVSKQVLECAGIGDNELTEVAAVSADVVDRVRDLEVIFSADPAGTQAIALWGGSRKADTPALIDGTQPDASVELYVRYGNAERLYERLGSVLSRAQQYRAWWGAPAAMVLLLVVIVGGLVALALAPSRLRLPLLLVAVAAKGILWSVLLPPLETPDEPAHFAYAQFLAEERAIPDRYEQKDGRGPFSNQLRAAIEVVHQPLLNPGDRPDFGPGPQGPDDHLPDRESPRSGGGGNPAAGYAPPYFLGAAVAYALPPADFFTSLSTMRLWSVALGVGAIWLVVGIGRRALRDEAAAFALAIAVAFQPVWTQATAAVNNDAGVVLAGAACTVVALDLALRPNRARLPLIAGLVLGGALLTKPFAIAFAAPLAIGWLIGRLRGPRLERRWTRDVGAAALGLTATFGGWMLLAKALGIPTVTTDDAGIAAGTRTTGQYLRGLTEDGFHTLHLNWVDRLWGNLSWTDTPPPPLVDSVLARVTIVVLGLGAVWVVLSAIDIARRRRPPWRSALSDDGLAALVLGSAVIAPVVLLHLIEMRYFLRSGHRDLLAGRYLMMALPAILGVIPLVVHRFAARIPIAATTTALGIGMIVLHVVAIDTILEHFYL